jgi:3-oxoacyl-[acyl-carrier-protein] synthase-1
MPGNPLALTATTAVSAMGHGAAATLDSLLSGRHFLRPNDFDHGGADCVTGSLGWIGRVEGVEHHRLPDALAAFECRNNRLADMALRTDGFDGAVAAAVRRHGADRIAVVLGTSTSGVLCSEEAYAARGPDGALPASFDYARTHDMFSVAHYVRAALGLQGPAMVISTACASAAKAFIEARHLISAGLCDAAVVGGVDTLCRLTLRGFAALGLISPTPCSPCDVARNGISIGEAAGFALLEPGDGPVLLLGAGASSDGYHMSSPHPEGAGAIAAIRGALAMAGLPPAAVDYISLHGTGTKANDAMEDGAVTAVFGPGMACGSVKGWTGHTLGASGIVGAMIAKLAIGHGFMPASLGMVKIDPSFRTRVLAATERRPVRRVVVNSFGFGGINCSLLFGTA